MRAAKSAIASVLVGLRAAFVLDTPAGPTMVCVAAICFALISVFGVARTAVGR
jgi:zinc transport system permease protein